MGNAYPIGIFDSGVGGLTVVRTLLKELPQENFIYLGDTAHVPYGNKTVEQLFSYAYSITDFFIAQKVKAIIVACGTHSSITLPRLSLEYNCLPILGVLKPGALAASRASRNGRIGVLATQATVNSQAYTKEIKQLKPELEVLEVACPKFVPLVEAGKLNGTETTMAVAEYVEPLLSRGIDTIILGCTHYPFLSAVIKEYVGEEVELIDPSGTTITELKKVLTKQHLLNETYGKSHDNTSHRGVNESHLLDMVQEEPSPLHREVDTKEPSPCVSRRFLVSGNDESFYTVGNLLLNNIITRVEKIDLD